MCFGVNGVRDLLVLATPQCVCDCFRPIAACLQMLNHQGTLHQGKAAIISKLEQVMQEQRSQQAQHGIGRPAAQQQAWQLSQVDRQPLLQVSLSFGESCQSHQVYVQQEGL